MPRANAWEILDQFLKKTFVTRAGQQNYMFVSMHIPKKFKKKMIRTHTYIYKDHGGSCGHKI